MIHINENIKFTDLYYRHMWQDNDLKTDAETEWEGGEDHRPGDES